MKFSNEHELPDYLQEWLKFDDYDYIEGVISATGLMDSARKIILKARHFDTLEVDMADFIDRRVGTAIHNSFEDVPMKRIQKEKRVVCEIAGRKISGKYDMLKELTHGIHRIIDIKTTRVSNYMYGTAMEEWKTQLSIYKYILEHDGWTVERVRMGKDEGEWVERKAIKADNFAEICLIFKNWSLGEALARKDYPPIKVGNMSTNLFAEEVTEGFIIERLTAIEEAEKIENDDDLPFCNDEELWKDDDKWAVLKDGNVRPKIFDTEEAAKIQAAHITESTGKDCTITHRIGLAKACNYCDARSVCNQYKQLLENELIQIVKRGE